MSKTIKRIARVRVTVLEHIDFYMDADAISEGLDGVCLAVGTEVPDPEFEDFVPSDHPAYVRHAGYSEEPSVVLGVKVANVLEFDDSEYRSIILDCNPLENGYEFCPEEKAKAMGGE